MFRFLFYFSILVFSTSCYNRLEGCLDIVSSNYNPNADDACSNCCKNPELKLTIKHRLKDVFYSPSDSLTNNIGQSYKLLDFAYYLSDIYPVFTSGQKLEGVRKIQYQFQNSSQETADHFILVRPDIFDFNINEIRQNGQYDSLSLTFGLEKSIRESTKLTVLNDHILSDSLFLKDMEGNKIWGYMLIAKGSMFQDTLSLYFKMDENPTTRLLPKIISNTIGTNLNYTLQANYALWFHNVDFNTSSPEVKKEVLKNLTSVFFVE